MSILKPGSGTNYYYAKRHGEPIKNVVDCLGVTFFDDYRPTGASNSIDAAQVLWNGGPPEPRQPRVEGGVTFRSATPEYYSPPVEDKLKALTPEEIKTALLPGNGWSADDCRRQQQALQQCPGLDGRSVVNSGFDQSTALGNSSFAKSGWAAGLGVASAVAGMAGLTLVLSNPSTAVALLVGAAAGVAGSAHLVSASHRETNEGNIFRDMACRIHQKAYGTSEPRKSSQGNYAAERR